MRMPRTAENGRYRISVVDDHLIELVERMSRDNFSEELKADLKKLDLNALFDIMPYKKSGGGFMMNRKPILKKYVHTAYNPDYHASKLRCVCLRIVPIDMFNARISLDDVTIEADSLHQPDYIQ